MKQVRVPAKINLHLQVVGRRTDGFHELRTIFQSVGLWDVVAGEAVSSSEIELEVVPAGLVGAGEDNLVIRAAKALRQVAGADRGAHLKLIKRIPVGGGMGGGSADAAATLVLLNHIWSLGLGHNDLHQIAASLGSDVPFFLSGGLALGTGRGEEIWPLGDCERLFVMLVFPPTTISTAEVFGNLDLSDRWSSMSESVYSGLVDGSPRIEWEAVGNDLQKLVCERSVEVAAALQRLEKGRCVHAAMTGSGSCVFAVYRNEDDARRDLRAVTENGGSVEIVPMLARNEARLRVAEGDPQTAGGEPAN